MTKTKSALFVDFDNIYLGLIKSDKKAATKFATDPQRWVAWLESEFEQQEGGESRRILTRLCYLNPTHHGRFRADYIRAGFRVVDCPSLTKQGKNSADIFMVLDIIDTLNHTTQFDEFIILSGDADFTPVLLRLREHDRRSIVVGTGHAPAAYAACCETLIPDTDFIEQALVPSSDRKVTPEKRAIVTASPKVAPHTEPSISNEGMKAAIKEVAEQLARFVETNGEVTPTSAVSIYREVPAFKESSNWLGQGSRSEFTRHIVSLRDDVDLVEDGASITKIVRCEPAPKQILPPNHDLREKAIHVISESMQASDVAKSTDTIMHDLINEVGDIVRESNWMGAGAYLDLLEELVEEIPPLMITSGKNRFVFDRERHTPPEDVDQWQIFEDEWPNLFELATGICRVTNTPKLNPEQYAVLFRHIADEISEFDEYELRATSQRVRDRCLKDGRVIGRNDVVFVLKAIQFSQEGFTPREGMSRAKSIAEVFAQNVEASCEGAQMVLTTEEYEYLFKWFLKEFEDEIQETNLDEATASTLELSKPK